ncbi:MAG: MCE family protein, partial [Rhodocyclaceae bacterium]|nr:MCE family protein [Rhodocyclaceae bacterium]
GAFLDDTSLQRFRSTLERLESAAGGLDRTFETAPRTLEAVQALFSADNLARWSAMLAHLESASAEAGPALAEMRGLMRSLQHTLSSVEALTVEAADGVLHDTLPQVNALIGEINTTAVQLGRLVESLEASPQMLITGRGAQRPGPGEHGFAP